MKRTEDPRASRRSFLKTTALAGGAVMASAGAPQAAATTPPRTADELDEVLLRCGSELGDVRRAGN